MMVSMARRASGVGSRRGRSIRLMPARSHLKADLDVAGYLAKAALRASLVVRANPVGNHDLNLAGPAGGLGSVGNEVVGGDGLALEMFLVDFLVSSLSGQPLSAMILALASCERHPPVTTRSRPRPRRGVLRQRARKTMTSHSPLVSPAGRRAYGSPSWWDLLTVLGCRRPGPGAFSGL